VFHRDGGDGSHLMMPQASVDGRMQGHSSANAGPCQLRP
jgi:hypothetical protein